MSASNWQNHTAKPTKWAKSRRPSWTEPLRLHLQHPLPLPYLKSLLILLLLILLLLLPHRRFKLLPSGHLGRATATATSRRLPRSGLVETTISSSSFCLWETRESAKLRCSNGSSTTNSPPISTPPSESTFARKSSISNRKWMRIITGYVKENLDLNKRH